MYTQVAGPYVFVLTTSGNVVVKQSLMVDNAVSKFQAKCAKIGFVPNVVNGRIML